MDTVACLFMMMLIVTANFSWNNYKYWLRQKILKLLTHFCFQHLVFPYFLFAILVFQHSDCHLRNLRRGVLRRRRSHEFVGETGETRRGGFGFGDENTTRVPLAKRKGAFPKSWLQEDDGQENKLKTGNLMIFLPVMS